MTGPDRAGDTTRDTAVVGIRTADRVAEILHYRFHDPTLLAAACNTSSPPFGTLEHLGDAIADLAVGLACWAAGMEPAEASNRVANAALDVVFHRHFEGLVAARSGDVVEALVGAVHLDGGFTAASRVAVRLCDPTLSPVSLPERPLTSLLPASDVPDAAWVGNLLIDAICTDAIVTAVGITATSQRTLSDARTARTNNVVLAARVRRCGVSMLADDRRALGEFRCRSVATLLGAGYPTTRRLVLEVLDG